MYEELQYILNTSCHFVPSYMFEVEKDTIPFDRNAEISPDWMVAIGKDIIEELQEQIFSIFNLQGISELKKGILPRLEDMMGPYVRINK